VIGKVTVNECVGVHVLPAAAAAHIVICCKEEGKSFSEGFLWLDVGCTVWAHDNQVTLGSLRYNVISSADCAQSTTYYGVCGCGEHFCVVPGYLIDGIRPGVS
jgi:hypothetical protein